MTKKFTEEEVDSGLDLLIKQGLLARIILHGQKVQYINSCQINIRCMNCGSILNEDKRAMNSIPGKRGEK